MYVIPIGFSNSQSNNLSFGAKLSNIVIKDDAAESIKKLNDMFSIIPQKSPQARVKVGNKIAKHSEYMLGYDVKLGDGYSISILEDAKQNRIYDTHIIHTQKNKKNATVTSFNYYAGHNKANNSIPEITYMEVDTPYENQEFQIKRYSYKEGSKIPDQISDKIKIMTDAALKLLGAK